MTKYGDLSGHIFSINLGTRTKKGTIRTKMALFTQFYDKCYVNNLIHSNKGKDIEWIRFESISHVRLL